MLEFDGVTLVHNIGTTTEVTAVRGLDLQIPRGQFVTVVGSNGAGKSSMIKLICGAERPTTGRVVINGNDVSRSVDYDRAQYVGRVFDNPHAGTAPDLSIEENMALAMRRGKRRRLVFAVNGHRRKLMREKLAHLGLGLEDRLSAPVSLLSAGQRQSLTMIMASLTDPEVLLLDEHLAALDPRTAERVLDLTVRLAAELGSTTIMVTHNMDQAISVGDRMLVMSGGRVVADLSGDAKRSLTPADVIAHITQAGGSVTDRMLLSSS
jgi:putative ABC transport system ATP-binding protein